MKKKVWVGTGVLGLAVLAVGVWYLKSSQRVAVTKALDRQLASVAYDALDPELRRAYGKTHQEAKQALKQFFPDSGPVIPQEYYSVGFMHPTRSGYQFSLNLDVVGAGRSFLEAVGLKKDRKFSTQSLTDQHQFIEGEIDNRAGRIGLFSLLRIQDKQMAWLMVYFIVDEGKLRSVDADALSKFLKLGEGEPEPAASKKIQLYLSEQAYDQLDLWITFLSWVKIQIPVMPYGVDGLITLGVHGDLAPVMQGEPTPIAFVPQEGYRGVLRYMWLGQHVGEIALDREAQKGAAQVFVGRYIQNTFDEPANEQCRQSFVQAGSSDDFSSAYRPVRLSGFDVCMKTRAINSWVRTAVQQIAKVSRQVGDVAALTRELQTATKVNIDPALISGVMPAAPNAAEQAALRAADAAVPAIAPAPGPSVAVRAADESRGAGAAASPVVSSPSPVSAGAAATTTSDGMSADALAQAMKPALRDFYTQTIAKIDSAEVECKARISANDTLEYNDECSYYRTQVRALVNRQVSVSDFQVTDATEQQRALTAYRAKRVEIQEGEQRIIRLIQQKGWPVPAP